MNPFSIQNDNGDDGDDHHRVQSEYGEGAASNFPEDDDDDEEVGPLIVPLTHGGGSGVGGRRYRDNDDDNDDDTHGRHNDSVRARRSGSGSGIRQGALAAAGGVHLPLRRGLSLVFLLFAGGLGLRLLLVSPGIESSSSTTDKNKDDASVSAGSAGPILYDDPDRPVPRLDGDSNKPIPPRSYRALRDEFRAGKDAYVDRLRNQYGSQHFDAIFAHQNVTMGRLALRSASLEPDVLPPPGSSSFGNNSTTGGMGPSWERLKRRFLKKLLEAQIGLASHSNNNHNNKRMPTFVWATGGHSAAAAHGDLYNESYSAVLERAVQPVLQRLGVWFEARNYAMGGTMSAPELALCSVPIYGTAVDAISWDFGMTDGRDVSSMEMYFRQASLGPGRPSCVALEIQGYVGPRRSVLRSLENSGVAALYMPPDVVNTAHSGIPDSFGKTDAELQAMPPFVRSFKCEGALEKGEPGCSKEKWTPACPDAKYRTSWHPGWKWHALVGNLLGLSLLEAVDDALAEMETLDLKRESALSSALQELQALEDRDYEAFARSEPTDYNDGMIKDGVENMGENLNLTSLLFTKRPYCHTARLPAETRYLGILTESSEVGFYHYDRGVSKRHAQDEANSNSTQIRLAYDADERQKCELLLQVDYKDYFYVGEPEGAKSLVLPNDAELRAYGVGGTDQKPSLAGIVGFTFAACDWGKCPQGNLLEPQLDTGEWEMSVNGVPVTGRVRIAPSGDAVFVRHRDGWHFPPNDKGRYEIQVRVTAVGHYVRFSSLMIF
jgi:hypothetical protein